MNNYVHFPKKYYLHQPLSIFCTLLRVTSPLRVLSLEAETEIAAWCKQHGFAFLLDREGYICVARDAEIVRFILSVDQSVEPHEAHLGRLLGYPPCCCDFIASIGEANIDSVAREMMTWSFKGRFSRINPAAYLEGRALICHLPCSSQCLESLKIAEKALTFIESNAKEPMLEPWLVWVDK